MKKILICTLLALSVSACSTSVTSFQGSVNQDIEKTSTSNKDNSYTSPSNSGNTRDVEITILNSESSGENPTWYKFDDNTLIMKPGSKISLLGTANLNDGTKSSNVEWSSSDNTIATVRDGNISGNKVGKVSIVATSVMDSSKKAIFNIIVSDDNNFIAGDISKIKGIEAYALTNFGKQTSLKLGVNSTIDTIAIVTLNDGAKNSNITWESSDSNIATVDSNGKIMGKKTGVTTILARYKFNPNLKGIINVEVSENAPNNQVLPSNSSSNSGSSIGDQISAITNSREESLVNLINYLKELKTLNPSDAFQLELISTPKIVPYGQGYAQTGNGQVNLVKITVDYKTTVKPEYAEKMMMIINKYKKYLFKEDGIFSTDLASKYLNTNPGSDIALITGVQFLNQNNEVIAIFDSNMYLRFSFVDKSNLFYERNVSLDLYCAESSIKDTKDIKLALSNNSSSNYFRSNYTDGMNYDRVTFHSDPRFSVKPEQLIYSQENFDKEIDAKIAILVDALKTNN